MEERTVIDYNEMTIGIGNNKGKIAHFEIWWQTPFGTCGSFEEAKEKLKSVDMPLEILRPVVAVICENGLYEIIL